MKAFLLAGGHGTRLRPLTDAVPKCLLPICGTPLLAIWLDLCFRSGITDVLINLHAHAAAIEDFLRQSHSPVRVRVVCEKELLGSAGTLVANRQWALSEKVFWILYADVLTNANLPLMSEFHLRHQPIATLGLCQVQNPSECGIAITDRRGVVLGFEEKPARPHGNWAFSGLMLAGQEFLDRLPSSVPADIGLHVLPGLTGRMLSYPIAEYLLDIGTMPNYLQAQVTWPEASPRFLARGAVRAGRGEPAAAGSPVDYPCG
jgi:mannose-1-phosphate guanylyltransferase